MFKKIFLGAMTCLALLTTQAQEVQLQDGRKTILIDSNNYDQNQEMRIRRLERAVRDLQDQVWQIGTPRGQRNFYVCKVTPFSTEFKSDVQSLEYVAKEQVLSRCESKYHKMHCSDIKCEKIH